MPEPEFERQVKLRMDELKFTPSGSVWAAVEKQIRNDRKKRRHVFWILTLGAFLLAGGMAYLGMVHRILPFQETEKASVKGNMKPGPVQNPASPAAVSSYATAPEANRAGLKNGSHGNDPAATADGPSKTVLLQGDEKGGKRTSHPGEEGKAGLVSGVEPISDSKLSLKSQDGEVPRIQITLPSAGEGIRPAIPDGKLNAGPLPAAIVPARIAPAPAANDALVKPGNKYPWKFGIQVAPGVSNVFSSLLTPAGTANAGYYVPAGSYSGSVSGLPPGYYPYRSYSPAPTPTGSGKAPAALYAGFSVGAGLSAEKSISRSWYFSTGLNYHYYSTSAMISGPGGNSQSYVNKYHFLEIPLNLGYRTDQRKRWPLSATAGISLGQLLSTQAVHYDYSTGTYFRNSDFFRRTQFMVNAAMLAGIPSRGPSLRIGPIVQYGLTNLLVQDGGRPEHLFFAGLQFVILGK